MLKPPPPPAPKHEVENMFSSALTSLQHTALPLTESLYGRETNPYQPKVEGQPDALTRMSPEEQARLGKLSKTVTMAKTGLTAVIYFGFCIIIEALLSMETPTGSNANCPDCPWSYTPPVPPALECLIILAIQYFALYLALYIAETHSLLRNLGKPTLALQILTEARDTVKFCPMLSVLFIGARLRALQLNAEPQPWAQTAMFVCAYSVLGQTLMVIFGPLVQSYWRGAGVFMGFLRYAMMAGLYIGTAMHESIPFFMESIDSSGGHLLGDVD